MKKGSLRKAFRSSRKLLLIWAVLIALALASKSGTNLSEPGAFDSLEESALSILVYLVRGLGLLLVAALIYFIYKVCARLISRFS